MELEGVIVLKSVVITRTWRSGSSSARVIWSRRPPSRTLRRSGPRNTLAQCLRASTSTPCPGRRSSWRGELGRPRSASSSTCTASLTIGLPLEAWFTGLLSLRASSARRPISKRRGTASAPSCFSRAASRRAPTPWIEQDNPVRTGGHPGSSL